MKSDIDLFADFLTEVITRHWDELEISIFGKHKNEHINELYSMFREYSPELSNRYYEYVITDLTKFVTEKKPIILSLMQRVS